MSSSALPIINYLLPSVLDLSLNRIPLNLFKSYSFGSPICSILSTITIVNEHTTVFLSIVPSIVLNDIV